MKKTLHIVKFAWQPEKLALYEEDIMLNQDQILSITHMDDVEPQKNTPP